MSFIIFVINTDFKTLVYSHAHLKYSQKNIVNNIYAAILICICYLCYLALCTPISIELDP